MNDDVVLSTAPPSGKDVPHETHRTRPKEAIDMKHAKIVKTKAVWEKALEEVRKREKALTRKHDALAAERRRLPWLRIEKDYVFQGPDGQARLVDLYDGRRQLLLYHFMFGPNQEAGCEGCSMLVDQIGHPRTCTRATPRSCWSRARRSRSSRPTASAWGGACRGSRRTGPPSTPTSAVAPRCRSRTRTRTARCSA